MSTGYSPLLSFDVPDLDSTVAKLIGPTPSFLGGGAFCCGALLLPMRKAVERPNAASLRWFCRAGRGAGRPHSLPGARQARGDASARRPHDWALRARAAFAPVAAAAPAGGGKRHGCGRGQPAGHAPPDLSYSCCRSIHACMHVGRQLLVFIIRCVWHRAAIALPYLLTAHSGRPARS